MSRQQPSSRGFCGNQNRVWRRGRPMLSSTECRALAAEKIAQAERKPGNRKRLCGNDPCGKNRGLIIRRERKIGWDEGDPATEGTDRAVGVAALCWQSSDL